MREEGFADEAQAPLLADEAQASLTIEEGLELTQEVETPLVTDEQLTSTTLFRSVLPPPTTLIRDDLDRLRKSEVYRGAFFIHEEQADDQDDDDSSLEASSSDAAVSRAFEPVASLPVAEEKKEASSEEVPFLFPQAVEAENQRDSSRDLP
jgi:hypothetical protein